MLQVVLRDLFDSDRFKCGCQCSVYTSSAGDRWTLQEARACARVRARSLASAFDSQRASIRSLDWIGLKREREGQGVGSGAGEKPRGACCLKPARCPCQLSSIWCVRIRVSQDGVKGTDFWPLTLRGKGNRSKTYQVPSGVGTPVLSYPSLMHPTHTHTFAPQPFLPERTACRDLSRGCFAGEATVFSTPSTHSATRLPTRLPTRPTHPVYPGHMRRLEQNVVRTSVLRPGAAGAHNTAPVL